jgi:ribosomal protein S18 acetylase RimI-like enzyme
VYEPGIVVREAQPGDAREIAALIVRFYMLNEEFDPAWTAVESVEAAERLAKRAIEAEDEVVLVAEVGGVIAGVARAVLVDEPMLSNSPLAVLKELYVKPEYRRRGIASKLVEEAFNHLKKLGAKVLAAEFPSQNEVAERFYEKLGFRPFKSVYIREA